MTTGQEYDEDYFERGEASGKSLYSSYRWLPNLTLTMCRHIVDALEVELSDTILDYGAAKGFIVRALTQLGYDAYGLDISRYAIESCDPTVKDKLLLYDGYSPLISHDWIWAKDTLEHLADSDLIDTLVRFSIAARKGVFIVVPLADSVGERYVVPDYEKDVTHKIRWPMLGWLHAIEAAFGVGWSVQFQFRMEGVKENYAKWPKGNGFITVRKLSKQRPD